MESYIRIWVTNIFRVGKCERLLIVRSTKLCISKHRDYYTQNDRLFDNNIIISITSYNTLTNKRNTKFVAIKQSIVRFSNRFVLHTAWTMRFSNPLQIEHWSPGMQSSIRIWVVNIFRVGKCERLSTVRSAKLCISKHRLYSK